MKNFFKITVLAVIFCLAAGCENSIGRIDLEESGGDQTDSGISEDDADKSDSGEQPDQTDTENPEETDNDFSDTTTDEESEENEENDSDGDNETAYQACGDILDCASGCSDNECLMNCYNSASEAAQNDFMAYFTCRQSNCPGGSGEDCIYENCENEAAVCGMVRPEKYKSPYGSISFEFENLIGTENDPGSYNEIFAEGTYGNGTEEIAPEYADLINTMAFVHNEYIEIQQTPIYDSNPGNPVVIFYLPLETAPNIGIYTLALNGDATVILADVDWSAGQIQCYHAFGEGQIEIEESNITDEFKVISFFGNATLYHPLNYNGEDVSAEFLQTFTGANMLCDPVD